ncbi:MAG TPA: helix-turn-helix domain-containing protein, partial [Tepidisphaeraceae bacterium]
MDDLEKSIRAAWSRIRPTLSPSDITHRLTRIHTNAYQRPPRPWCLAIRATDTRLNEATAIISPRCALSINPSTGRFSPHSVTLDRDSLLKLCSLIHLSPPGHTIDELSALLGVSRSRLLWPRIKNRFRTHYITGLEGKHKGRPRPLLYTDKSLDPNALNFQSHHPLWTWTSTHLLSRIPNDFSATVTRIPAYTSRTNHYADNVDLASPVLPSLKASSSFDSSNLKSPSPFPSSPGTPGEDRGEGSSPTTKHPHFTKPFSPLPSSPGTPGEDRGEGSSSPTKPSCFADELSSTNSNLHSSNLKPKPSLRLPPPPPDYVAYKYKDGIYVAHDWRNPHAATRYHKNEQRKAHRRNYERQRRRLHPKPHKPTGSLTFQGYRFLCPTCGKPTNKLYLPLPPLDLPL